MVPVTRSDTGALEHILSIVLSEPAPTGADPTITPFRACFNAAGVTTATDFMSMDPAQYGAITFSLLPSGNYTDVLNAVQVKKINSLFSWYRQVPIPTVSRWFDLDASIFQVWRITPPTPVQNPATLHPPLATSNSAIYDFRKGVKRSLSDYNIFKEDRLWHSWNRHLMTTARSHNVDNVLNLSYIPSTADDIALLQEQKRFVFSVLEQKVQTSDGVVFIRMHSSSGDATAVYKDLVDRYSKSTAAQLSAAELEQELSAFRLDDTWKQTNLMFLNSWATKILDLDLVLLHPTSESQKRIWFLRAIAPKLILSMSISQFEASEKLTGMAFGSSYQKAPFSTLFDHVKDDAIRIDQQERLLQSATRRANEAITKTKEKKPPHVPGTPTTDPKVFVGRDGKPHSYLIDPEVYKKMTEAERFAELKRLKEARKYSSNKTVISGNTTPAAGATPPVADAPTSMIISYVDAVQGGATPSVMSSVQGYPPSYPVPPSVGLETSAGGTNNLIRQILSSNRTVATPPSTTTTTVPSTIGNNFVLVDGTYYRRCNVHRVHYDVSQHSSHSPNSSLIDGGANGGMPGVDVRIISTSDFHKANVTGIGGVYH